MEIEQIDIRINDFILRIKHNGEWIRLSTGAGMFIEGKDWELDISSAEEIIKICRFLENKELNSCQYCGRPADEGFKNSHVCSECKRKNEGNNK